MFVYHFFEIRAIQLGDLLEGASGRGGDPVKYAEYLDYGLDLVGPGYPNGVRPTGVCFGYAGGNVKMKEMLSFEQDHDFEGCRVSQETSRAALCAESFCVLFLGTIFILL